MASSDEDIDAPDIPPEAFYAAGAELWSQEGSYVFLDPLTCCPMEHPVVAADGHTYEHRSIEEWIAKNGLVSPVTRAPLANGNLTPNVELRKRIQKAIKSSATTTASAKVNTVTIRELNHIFSHLDPVRPVLDRTLAGWRPPQIVVVGQESAGKSTQLS